MTAPEQWSPERLYAWMMARSCDPNIDEVARRALRRTALRIRPVTVERAQEAA